MCHPCYDHNGGDANRKGTLFSRLHIYYVHLAYVQYEYSMFCGSLKTLLYMYVCAYIYIYIWYSPLKDYLK